MKKNIFNKTPLMKYGWKEDLISHWGLVETTDVPYTALEKAGYD